MRKTNAQKPSAKPPRRSIRAPRPFSPIVFRARAVIHFTLSRCAVDGSGSPRGLGRSATPSAGSALGVEDIDQLARRVLAGESQEDLLETHGAGFRGCAEVGH